MNGVILAALLLASPPAKDSSGSCAYWRERIVTPAQRSNDWSMLSSSAPESAPGSAKDPWGVAGMNEADKLRAMECLLQSKGDLRNGVVSGGTSSAISQTFARSRANLVALYMISYLYEGRIDHASAIALGGKDAGCETKQGSYNTREEAIARAYEAYRSWLDRVRSVGLSKAKADGLDPLANTGLHWYQLSEPRADQR